MLDAAGLVSLVLDAAGPMLDAAGLVSLALGSLALGSLVPGAWCLALGATRSHPALGSRPSALGSCDSVAPGARGP